MVIKKPYAFIIRHFRIIHLLLLIPMLYLVFKSGAIASFLNDYVRSGYLFSDTDPFSALAGDYINFFMFISCLLVVGVYGVISFILQQKEKPTKFYNLTIVYYIILLVFFIVNISIFNSIEAKAAESVTTRIIRDIAYFANYLQYIFIIITVVRGIGFDIKKFDFKSDLKELEIKAEDSEEVEFLVGSDNYKRKRSIRRYFRELKYYYKENRFVFHIIFVILGIALALLLIFGKKGVGNQILNMGSSFKMGNTTVKINDVYLTHVASNGQVIKDNKDYIIVNLNLENTNEKDEKFNYATLQIIVDKNYISPTISLGSNFADYGVPFDGSYVKGKSKRDYILVYEIEHQRKKDEFKLVAYSSYNRSEDKFIEKEININVKKVNNVKETKYLSKDQIFSLEATSFKNTNIAIGNYEITNRITYNYQYCPPASECYTSTNDISINFATEANKNTLFVLDYVLKLDESSIYAQNNKDYISFFDDFLTLKYIYNNQEYQENVKLINPKSYSDKLVMKVPVQIKDATSIEAIINIRNISYIVKLK